MDYQDFDNLIVASAGSARPAATSMALMIPAGTGQAGWSQYFVAMRSVVGPSPLKLISSKGLTCLSDFASFCIDLHSLSMEISHDPFIVTSTVVLKPHIPAKISAFAISFFYLKFKV